MKSCQLTVAPFKHLMDYPVLCEYACHLGIYVHGVLFFCFIFVGCVVVLFFEPSGTPTKSIGHQLHLLFSITHTHTSTSSITLFEPDSRYSFINSFSSYFFQRNIAIETPYRLLLIFN